MTQDQENKLSMYNTTLTTLDKNSSQVALIPALVSAKSKFASAVQAIRKTNLIQLKTTVGKTLDKKALKVQLVDEAYTLAAAVQAYASSINDNDLFQLVHFSRSTLLASEDEELPQRCNLILEQATSVEPQLADFGVTAATLAEVEGLISLWDSKSQQPRMAISERAAATQEIPDLFQQADKVLKEQVDKLMEQFRTSDPTFYDTYKGARKIVNAGHGHSTVNLTGQMVDANTSQPIANATVRDVNTNNEASTDSTGLFELSKTQTGDTQLLCLAIGYLDQTLNVEVKTGMSPLIIQMMPE